MASDNILVVLVSVFDEISLTNELLVELVDNIHGEKDIKNLKLLNEEVWPVHQESGQFLLKSCSKMLFCPLMCHVSISTCLAPRFAKSFWAFWPVPSHTNV